MLVTIRRAQQCDAQRLWEMQSEAFSPLIEKYRSEAVNPACSTVERVKAQLAHPFSDYYVICADGEEAGGVRVIRRKDARCQISPLFVRPQYRRRGIARTAMKLLEAIYPNVQWELNTILEEKGNCRLYEKMGYRRTGEYERINEYMTLVYYRKKCPTEKTECSVRRADKHPTDR